MKVIYPWTEKDWIEYLYDEFKRCRASPGWLTILSAHDSDDCDYFGMLEELYLAGKIKTRLP